MLKLQKVSFFYGNWYRFEIEDGLILYLVSLVDYENQGVLRLLFLLLLLNLYVCLFWFTHLLGRFAFAALFVRSSRWGLGRHELILRGCGSR